jgi:hypothetical protein
MQLPQDASLDAPSATQARVFYLTLAIFQARFAHLVTEGGSTGAAVARNARSRGGQMDVH